MQGIIIDGNYSRQSVSLTGDAHFVDCNGSFCRVVTNGHSFTREGGNWRGHYVDGVKQDAFVLESKVADTTATDMLAKVGTKVGPDGIAMWLWVVDTIHANPAITTTQAKTAWTTWSTTNENAVYYDLAVAFLLKTFGTFSNMKAQILAKTPDTWRGLCTAVEEVVS